jgi:type II secretory pathway pseudopilin PulG
MLLLDLVVSLTIIGFPILISGGVLGRLSQNARETALRFQLNNLRMVLRLYKELKGQYSEDLQVLLATDYKVAKADAPVFSEHFLFNFKQDLNGVVLDAFGNRFDYDQRKGVVGSTIKGCQNW